MNGSTNGTEQLGMGIYSLLDKLPWPRSYMGRVLLVCFVGTHIPLLTFCVFMIAANAAAGPSFWVQIAVLLVATLVATGVTLGIVYGMLAPILAASHSLKAYREHRTLPSLPRHHRDEAGELLVQVQDTLEELNTSIHNLARAADTDPLTGVGNRRWLVNRASEHFGRARQTNTPVSLIIFDLDRFKSINDQHGHGTGDAVLIGVSRFVKNAISSTCLFARTGGEEFCIVLPNTSLPAAADVARKLQEGMSATRFSLLPEGVVTASFGVAERLAHETDFAATMRRADDLLYQAKGEGRNRVLATLPNEIV